MKRALILVALLLLPSVAHGGWLDPSWAYRQKITISATLADADLVGFPYLVKISDPGNPLFSAAQPGGDDILFSAGDGSTRLDHEIERYDNPSGELVAWVKIDTLWSTSDTEIYIYYGNGSASSQENPPGVWNPQYVGVWHLNEVSGGLNNILDSTINGHHGSTHGTPALGATGQMGAAIVFDGSDYIDVQDSPDMSFGLAESFTVSAWINVADIGTDWRAVVVKGHSNSTWYGIWTDGADSYSHYDGDTLSASPVTEGQWQQVVIVYEAGGATTKRIYLDGVEEGSNTYATTHDGAGDLVFGRPQGLPNDWFEGSLDEVRISNVPRSGEWISASFRNQDGPETYAAFGPEEAARVFVVNSTGDAPDQSPGDGVCDTGGLNSEGNPECTLRAVIEEANAWASADSVRFGIPASDPGYSAAPLHWTISPGSALPPIAEALIVDGTTQPGHAGTPVIELDGSLAGAGVNGLRAAGNWCTVRGLAVNRFDGNGIWISGTRNSLLGNLIGTDVTGTLDRGNGEDGVTLSGNDNTVGGALPEDRNVISGNRDEGVDVEPGFTGNVIVGNFIGTDISGVAAIGNGTSGWSGGVLLESGPNRLGGAAPGEGNLISGNSPFGVIVYSSAASVISGNRIGTDAAGVAPIPNTGPGIVIANGSAQNRLGGPGEGNTVAHNGSDGIEVQSSAGSGNAILANSIFANSGLGVDLGADGVTANDPGDGDTGPNDLLNYPVITLATESAGTVTVDFDLDVPAGDYRIEFFTNPSGADPSGSGEGESFASAVVVNHSGGGLESYSHSFAGVPGDILTATASVCTDSAACSTFGNTSEFCTAVTVLEESADLAVSKSVDDPAPSEGDTVTYTITVDNNGPSDATGIEVTDLLPAGVTYQSSAPTQGNYASGTGLWAAGSMASGASATLTLVVTVNVGSGGTAILNIATVTAADQVDPDGANNSASAGIAVIAPVPAPLAAGNGRLVYGNLTAPTASPKSRAWDRVTSTWSGVSTAAAADSTIHWLVHRFDPADSTEELAGSLSRVPAGPAVLHLLRFDGASWMSEWSSTTIDPAHADKRGFDLAYEERSGHALVVYSNDTSNPVYRTWDGASWSGEATVFASAPGTGTVLWVELVSRPSGNEIALVYADDGDDLFVVVWDGDQWIGPSGATLTTNLKTNPVTGMVSNRAFDAAYEESTGDLVVAWSETGRFGFLYSVKAAAATTFGAPTPVPAPAGGTPHFIDLASEPGGERIAGGFFDLGDGIEELGLATWDGNAWLDAGGYDSQIRDVNDGATGDFQGAAGWAGATAVVVYADDRTGTLDWARWVPGGGWTVQSPVPVPGKGYTESVAIESSGHEDELVAVITGDGGDLYAATSDGAGWAVTYSGLPLEPSVSSLESVPFSFALSNLRIATDLAVTHGVDNPMPYEGESVTYTVTVSNQGPHDAGGITVTDLLPAGLSYQSSSASQGGYASGTGMWTVGTVVNGGSATLILTATVDPGTGGATITATAAIAAADQADPDPTNDRASVDLTVHGADLALSKLVDNPAPAEVDSVTYTITVTNQGPDDATGIEVTDLLPAGVSYQSSAPSQGSYASGTGLWVVGGVSNGGTATLTLTAIVDAGTGGTTITNTAVITAAGQPDHDPGNNTDSADIIVNGADLSVSKMVDDPGPGEGDTISYSVTVTNNGPSDATGIEVTDLLPAGVSYQSSAPSQGSYASGTGLWVLGGVANGATATLTLTAIVDAGTGGSTIINTAALTATDQPDPDATNNSATAEITVELRPEYSMVVVATQPESHPLVPGGPLEEIFRIGIYNNTARAETLTAVTVENASLGPGTQAELDGEWTDLELVVDGAGTPETAIAAFAAGSAVLSGFAAPVAARDSLILTIRGAATLGARDSDSLDLVVNGPGDLAFSRPPLLLASWPLDPPGRYVVDGLVADQVGIEPVGPATFPIGSAHNLALEAFVPANGYEADELARLNVVNLGTAVPDTDLARMRGWVDNGDLAFDPMSDIPLGEFLHTGDRWELTGLAEPVPTTGIRLFIAVDIAEDARQGCTIRLSLPSLPDVAIGMASDNDGPIDVQAANPYELSISYVDRVAFAAVPVAPATAHPGDRDVLLLHLTAVNSYQTAKRVTGLTFTNRTIGGGSQAELDFEIKQLVLRRDGDQNGTLNIASDPVIGTSVFDGGMASFSGFVWEIAAGGSAHLFLTGNVSSVRATDGDLLGAAVAEELDIEFEEPAATAGSWPVDSGARWAVDGMLASQITNFGAPVATLSGGDGPVPALDLIVPANGYAADVLNALRVDNLGTATGADLAELRLWRDDGDGVFEGPGEDIDLGPMVWLGDGWASSVLAEPLTGAGARLFAALVVAAAPADSATVELAVPLGGIVTASGNDGPIDEQVVNPHTQLLSRAPLLSSLTIDPAVSTVGASVTVRMAVENAGPEAIDGIVPSPLVESGGGVLALQSGPQPPSFSLAPGGSDTFTWTYAAARVGESELSGNAAGTASGVPRRSIESASNAHRVLLEADDLRLFATGTLPPSVNRGEAELVAFNLSFTNDGGPEASDVLVQGLRLRLEDESGTPIIPAELLSRVVVSEGSTVYLSKTALETAGSEIDLTLATPIRVTSREPVTVSVMVDISAAATVPDFRALITDSGVFTVRDAVSGAPVTVVLEEGSYPVSSGLARLRDDATEVRVAAVPDPTVRRTQHGLDDVELLAFEVENRGIDLVTSGVRVISFGLAVTDTSGVLLPDPTVYLERIHARAGLQMFSDLVLSPGDSSRFELTLSPVLSLPVNAPQELRISADMSDAAPAGAFELRLADPVSFRARDANTGAPVAANYLSPPIIGPPVVVELPADSLLVGGSGTLPPVVIIGTADVGAMGVVLHHPGGVGTAAIRCEELRVQVRDQGGEPLVPASFFERMRLLRGDVEISINADPPPVGNSMVLPLSGVVLGPGETVELDLRMDVKATAPASHLELWVAQAGIVSVDATTGAGISPTPLAGEELPLTSGLTLLMSPPRELLVDLESRLPRVLAVDGDELPIGVITLENTAAPESGAITIDRLTLIASDRDFAPVPIGGALFRIRAYAGDSLWAEASDLAADAEMATLLPGVPLVVEPSSQVTIELRGMVREEPRLASFRLGVAGDAVGVIQPASPLLAIAVEPQAGAFPLWTAAASFGASTLEASYSNFPNPFSAGRETTSFVYYLPAAGQVTLKIWSPRGEHVLTLLDSVERGPGLHQSDQWDGRNGDGRLVLSDVFLAELVVSYGSGESARLLRKVAVIR